MEPARYSRTAITLHWLLAALLAFQIALGWRMGDLTAATGQFHAVQLHKSIGITILLLTLARVAVRLWKPRPAPHYDRPWARRLAGLVHFGLYLFMIGAPLTGWLIVSTSRIPVPTLLYETVPWPHIPGLDGAMRKPIHEAGETVHGALAWIGIALLALHVVGALRHQWLLRQPLIERMLPGGPARLSAGGALLAYGAALALLGGGFALGRTIDFSAGKATRPAAARAAPATAPVAPPQPPDAEPAAANATAPANEAEPADEATNQAVAAPAEAPVWTVAPGGRLGFTTSFTGSEIVGSFTQWSADIRFDPEALDRTRIVVRVDMTSAATGDAFRDETLRSDDFFAAATHAQAVFRSTSVRATGPGHYRAAGYLSLKGVRRPVTLTFTLAIAGDTAKVSGKGRINRGDFGVGTGEWEDSDRIPGPVAISFDFTAIRKD